jgi:hypothetical protein
VVTHASKPSSQEVEVGGSKVQGQPGLHSEFQGSLGYIVRSCLKESVGGREGGKQGEENTSIYDYIKNS